MSARLLLLSFATACAVSQVVQAHEPATPAVRTWQGHWGGPFGMWYGGWQAPVVINVPVAAPVQGQAPWQGGYDGQTLDRDSWLRECRRRLGDNGIGGAVIGGVLGGVAGNVIGGRGNRVLGTVAGATVGAAAGAALDKAEDRTRVADRCEAMLATPGSGSGAGQVQAYAFALPVMLVPVTLVSGQSQAQAAPRTETVVTEEIRYVPVQSRRRIVTRRWRDKRVAQ